MEHNFIELIRENGDEDFFTEEGRSVTFKKQVTVQLDGVVYEDIKLSYTSESSEAHKDGYMRIPCVRIDGERFNMDGEDALGDYHDFEVSTDSLILGK